MASRKLKALFAPSCTALLRGDLLQKMDQRTGSVTCVTMKTTTQGTVVEGMPQDVMFVIGEIANQGEDCLLKVESV